MTTISNKVRYYASSMAGAPALSGSAGTLIAVLDACLVTGFGNKTIDSLVVSGGIATANISSGHDFAEGDVLRISGATPAGLNSDWRLASVTATSVTWSVEGCGIADGTATGTITALRAPAGWEKVFSDGTTRAAYRSLNHADHNGLFLYVDDSGTTTARARGYETMTSIDAGAGPFPTDAQLSGGFWWAKASTTSGPRPWRIAADDRRIAVCPHYSTFAPDAAPGYCFGRLKHAPSGDAWATALSGANSSANAISSTVGDTPEKGLNVYNSTSTAGAGFVARGADGVTKSVSLTRVLRNHMSGATGASTYAQGDLNSFLPAGEALLCEGVLSAIVPRGLQAGPMLLCRNLASNISFPAGSFVGTTGNGAVVVWAGHNTGAWLLSLGNDGRWD